MLLRALTNGKVTGTGLLSTLSGNIVCVISTNNSAAAVVIVRKDGPQGKKIFDISTISSGTFPYTFAVDTEGSKEIYYDVSGTGASCQFFEYVN